MPPRNIAVRLSASYETLRTTIGDWGLVSKLLVAYEHPEPDNIHCHLLLTGVYVTNQNLKDTMRAHGVPLKGAGQLSFKESFKCPTTKKVIEINEETWPKYITYMSKGKYEPKYIQGFSSETVTAYKEAWCVNSTRDPSGYTIYLDFKKFLESRVTETLSWTSVVSYAHIFMMNKHRSHSRLMRAEQSTLIDDYCYHNNINKLYLLPYQSQPK